jgi:hypothetical protein
VGDHKEISVNQPSASALAIKELIFVPALITLAVTIVRLAGELLHGPQILFNSDAGGAWAVVGIVWLVPVLGVYFALKLAAHGHGPATVGRGLAAVGCALLGLLIVVVCSHVGSQLKIQQNFCGRLVYIWIVVLVAALVTFPGWPALFRTLAAYAYAARLPVAVVMFFAFWRDWGTHYDAMPSDMPEGLSLLAKYLWLGLFPQLIFWVGLTILVGMFFGSLAGLLARLARPKTQA